MKTLNICIGGEAGQGIVTIGEMLCKALIRTGLFILVTQDYQSRIRGGNNTFTVLTSDQPLLSPVHPIDILVALNAETLELHSNRLTPRGVAICRKQDTPVHPQTIPVPFQELGRPLMENTIALGVLAELLQLDDDIFMTLFQEQFGKKHADLLQENLDTFKRTRNWAKDAISLKEPLTIPRGSAANRLMLNGNQAIALGAMAAGMKFCAFYPMTPATSIPLFLASHAREMDLIVEQTEDEIAAINMAIGASFAGAPSMVATSGGGFALMTEGVSLAGMTETPIVIVVAQRPGPATGLPTRTEQADLEFILHAGHGEFSRAILTPGTPDECFHLTHRAFHLAEASQGPVFVMTDQFLADSYRAVEPFDLSNLQPIKAGITSIDGQDTPYLRYHLTDNGISPRLLPGVTDQLVVADSDEHTEDGHITEDLTIRKRMVEKRLTKLCYLFEQIIQPQYIGPEQPKKLLLSWGSTYGAALMAGNTLRKQNESVGNLHFSQVWPINPAHFLHRLQSAKEVIAVEGNATGQFARLIRRETGFQISKYVLRYDGLPITAEYILNQI